MHQCYSHLTLAPHSYPLCPVVSLTQSHTHSVPAHAPLSPTLPTTMPKQSKLDKHVQQHGAGQAAILSLTAKPNANTPLSIPTTHTVYSPLANQADSDTAPAPATPCVPTPTPSSATPPAAAQPAAPPATPAATPNPVSEHPRPASTAALAPSPTSGSAPNSPEFSPYPTEFDNEAMVETDDEQHSIGTDTDMAGDDGFQRVRGRNNRRSRNRDKEEKDSSDDSSRDRRSRKRQSLQATHTPTLASEAAPASDSFLQPSTASGAGTAACQPHRVACRRGGRAADNLASSRPSGSAAAAAATACPDGQISSQPATAPGAGRRGRAAATAAATERQTAHQRRAGPTAAHRTLRSKGGIGHLARPHTSRQRGPAARRSSRLGQAAAPVQQERPLGGRCGDTTGQAAHPTAAPATAVQRVQHGGRAGGQAGPARPHYHGQRHQLGRAAHTGTARRPARRGTRQHGKCRRQRDGRHREDQAHSLAGRADADDRLHESPLRGAHLTAAGE